MNSFNSTVYPKDSCVYYTNVLQVLNKVKESRTPGDLIAQGDKEIN